MRDLTLMGPAETPGRILYFEGRPPEYNLLVEKGYAAVDIFSLPRNNPFEDQAYLKAKLQGVEEGTIDLNATQMTALKMEIDLLFGKGGEKLVLRNNRAGETIVDVLNWGPSRHTYQGNSTLVEARANPLELAYRDEKEKLSQ